jgi:hypothetical protein
VFFDGFSAVSRLLLRFFRGHSMRFFAIIGVFWAFFLRFFSSGKRPAPRRSSRDPSRAPNPLKKGNLPAFLRAKNGRTWALIHFFSRLFRFF